MGVYMEDGDKVKNKGHKNVEKHKWKKGQSGNPKGRPKGARHLKTILQEYLDKDIDCTDPYLGKKTKKPTGEVLIVKLIKKAIAQEDLGAMREIMDRIDGKPIATTVNVDAEGSYERWLADMGVIPDDGDEV